MNLSIIIVNWNSKDYLQKCVASTVQNTRGLEFEILVIDSASYDGCGEMLRENFPQVRFIQSDKNLGFAKANNEAFKVSCGEFVLFLNPDTELLSPVINRVYSVITSLADAGAVGVRLLNPDGSLQTSCVQAFPTIANQTLNAGFLRKCFPSSSLWGMSSLFADATEPIAVDAISGAFIMIKRDVFESVGKFTEDYFMYSEDVDLCYKLRASGWSNYIVPRASLVHYGGGSSGKSVTSTFASVMMLESRWRYFCRTRSLSYGCIYRFSMLTICILRVLIAATPAIFERITGRGEGWSEVLRKWSARLRWTVGLESWARNR